MISQGWNELSLALLAEAFIASKGMTAEYEAFLQAQADEENVGYEE